MRSRNLSQAQAPNARIHPPAQAFYAAPFPEMHSRMREVLAVQGRLRCPVVRPSPVKRGAAELARLREAARAAGLPLSEAAR